ncbi:MAG: helix-turn-helix transcriptional regulator [Eubacteriales bacterium]
MLELDFKAIGLKIKERRRSLQITQDYMATALDVNPSHISNIECGRANPSLTALVTIANTLQCSVDYFIGGEYTYATNPDSPRNLEDTIMETIQYFDSEKKEKILKIIELL